MTIYERALYPNKFIKTENRSFYSARFFRKISKQRHRWTESKNKLYTPSLLYYIYTMGQRLRYCSEHNIKPSYSLHNLNFQNYVWTMAAPRACKIFLSELYLVQVITLIHFCLLHGVATALKLDSKFTDAIA